MKLLLVPFLSLLSIVLWTSLAALHAETTFYVAADRGDSHDGKSAASLAVSLPLVGSPEARSQEYNGFLAASADASFRWIPTGRSSQHK